MLKSLLRNLFVSFHMTCHTHKYMHPHKLRHIIKTCIELSSWLRTARILPIFSANKTLIRGRICHIRDWFSHLADFWVRKH